MLQDECLAIFYLSTTQNPCLCTVFVICAIAAKLIYLVYSMPELGVRNQCIFLAFYASCLLLCAVSMASQQSGSSVLTQMERFVCCSCEKQGLPSFFVSKRAVRIHMGMGPAAQPRGLTQTIFFFWSGPHLPPPGSDPCS